MDFFDLVLCRQVYSLFQPKTINYIDKRSLYFNENHHLSISKYAGCHASFIGTIL